MNTEELAQSIAAALQPNRNWTPEQRRVIASIMLIQECTFTEAAGALWQEMQKEGPKNAAWWAPHILNTWASSAGYRIQSARFDALKRQQITVVPSIAAWGPLTNVIRCEFDQDQNRATNSPSPTTTIPSSKTQPHWYNKVQSAWVRRMAAQRGAGQ